MKYRKAYKYVKTECDFKDLKKGDIFSLYPATESDRKFVNPDVVLIATEDPTPLDAFGRYEITATHLIVDEEWPGIPNNEERGEA